MKKNNDYNFDRLKQEIKDLPYKEQLIRLFEAKTKFLQDNPTWLAHGLFEVSFDQKCDLEIKKIKDIAALGN